MGGLPWLIAGDFNVIKEVNEASNPEITDLNAISRFKLLLDELELLDQLG